MEEDQSQGGWQLARRYARERSARRAAEGIAEEVTSKFYAANLELDRLNEELSRSNEVLESANRAIREFVSIASHDLRGPLTSILGFAGLLRTKHRDLTPDQMDEYLEIVLRQAGLLSRLVEDLLTVSRIEAGQVEAHIEEIYVRTALEETVRAFGDETDVVISSPSELKVKADPDHLERILTNYIGNALKYGEGPVEAGAKAVNGWVEIRVSDHGNGVPEEFLPRLFEKFARAEETARTKKGTGLGLSIVRGLARVNGGDAWYEPIRPHGACFALRLPKSGSAT